MIEVTNLYKLFLVDTHRKLKIRSKKEDFIAVDNVSFIAKPGKITGLVGENGAGKTTIMRILSGIIERSSGEVNVCGINIDEKKLVRTKIGVLFGGDPSLYDRLTARENILYFSNLNGISTRDANILIDNYAKKLNMEDYIDKRAKGLSRGMRQKVAIIRSVIHSPEVIILDEPSTGLDVSAIYIIHQFLEIFKSEGKTILLSSHSVFEIEKLCDEVYIIHKGRIVEHGTLPNLKDKYQSNFEELFIKLIGGDTNAI